MNEELLFAKIEHLESLIIQLNDKIDHFLGQETISERELDEIRELRSGVQSGEFVPFDIL